MQNKVKPIGGVLVNHSRVNFSCMLGWSGDMVGVLGPEESPEPRGDYANFKLGRPRPSSLFSTFDILPPQSAGLPGWSQPLAQPKFVTSCSL